MANSASISGNVLTISADGVTVTVAQSGTSTSLTLASGTWSAVPAGWSGGGTATATGATSGYASGLVWSPTTGTNVLNLRYAPNGVTFSPSGGTNTVNVNDNAATNTAGLTGVQSTVTVAPTGGSTAVVVSDSGATSGNSAVVIDSTGVSGMAGASDNKAISLTQSSGAITGLTVKGSGSTTLGESYTVNNPPYPLTLQLQTGPDTLKLKACSQAATVTSGLIGAKTVQLGTAAGSAAGLDAITAAVDIQAGPSGNSIRIDDSGSASGSKTVTITPATTQNVNTTVTGLAGATISYRAANSSGSFGGGLRFDLSTVGSNAVTVATNPFLDNATLAFGGTGNTLNLSALTGLVDSGGGVYTQANGKTITVTGTATVTLPAVAGSFAAAFMPGF